MIGVRGAFAQLGTLHRQLAQLAAKSFAIELNRQLAAEAMAQLQLCFRASRDPYGTAWAALQRRQGNPLLDTGRLRNSFARDGLSARLRRVGGASEVGDATCTRSNRRYFCAPPDMRDPRAHD